MENNWEYVHRNGARLEIIEGKKGLSAVYNQQRTTVVILKLPPGRENVLFEQKVEFMLDALLALRLYLVPPPGMKASNFKHFLNAARNWYETKIAIDG